MIHHGREGFVIAKDLVKYFPVKKGVFSRTVGHVRAVDGVSFTIPEGKTLSLVGESGCGKTTTGRMVLNLIPMTSGRVIIDGLKTESLDRKGMLARRKKIQVIFQDPFSSLNPRMSVASMLTEAMKIHRIGTPEERRHRVFELLHLVGLPPESAGRYPHEFSGGQRQRIGIARALAVEPRIIVADEPVSALDVSIQAQILNLLKDLQDELGLTFLFVGHDLSVIRHISSFVAVMYLGRIVELGTVEDIFERPTHPYTKALLGAVPVADPDQRRKRVVLEGDVPSPMNPPPGCHFHPRCPEAVDGCSKRDTALKTIEEGHSVACHVHAPLD
jgi:oligopeptide transport system ATP-binding protein